MLTQTGASLLSTWKVVTFFRVKCEVWSVKCEVWSVSSGGRQQSEGRPAGRPYIPAGRTPERSKHFHVKYKKFCNLWQKREKFIIIFLSISERNLYKFVKDIQNFESLFVSHKLQSPDFVWYWKPLSVTKNFIPIVLFLKSSCNSVSAIWSLWIVGNTNTSQYCKAQSFV